MQKMQAQARGRERAEIAGGPFMVHRYKRYMRYSWYKVSHYMRFC
jgi:hypothetical protein